MDEILQLAELIFNLACNTRVQEFNGYKPRELQDKYGELPKRLKRAIKREFPEYYEMLGY